jgi:hypothetical protein
MKQQSQSPIIHWSLSELTDSLAGVEPIQNDAPAPTDSRWVQRYDIYDLVGRQQT